MDASSKKTTSFQKKDRLRCSASNGAKTESNLLDSTEEAKSKGSSLPPLPLGWPIGKAKISKCRDSDEKENQRSSQLDDSKFIRISSKISDIEMMKEKFSKLLLGEDMSGTGKGVCTALAISNAITNLCATVFGQLWRLEPLPCAKKSMWQREMECLLQVSDHIVELIPCWQTFPDGSKLEVMSCRPRSDVLMNLPALRKLDNMLLEILDSFTRTEFWYIDKGIVDGSDSFRQAVQRREEQWWLPVPRVPPCGLSEESRKKLNHTRECANQILKAAMAINNMTLAEMEVPESYIEALPKNGRSCVGDFIYRYMTSDRFCAETLLDCLDLSSEHVALEIGNRIEASIYVWRGRTQSREILAQRAENVLVCLKQRFPSLTQTTLDTTKIQYNKDVGKSILESYSRVLESMAFNIVARIDDLRYVDDLSIQYSVDGRQKKISQTLTAVGTPRPTPIKNNNNGVIKAHHRRGFGVKRVLSNYLRVETKAKIVCNHSNQLSM